MARPESASLPRVRLLLVVPALFSGIALLANLLLNWSLPLGLAATAALGILAVVVAYRRADRVQQQVLRQIIAAGAPAGLLATVVYDATRTALSLADPSPYNPFEAVRAFGVLFTGGESALGWGIGIAFHILNGTAFGVAWCLAFGHLAVRGLRLALITGVGWGLFLELFQISLYPGWLDIRAYSEFVTISAVGHLVYGGVLGLLGSRWLRRSLARNAVTRADVEEVRRRLGAP